MVTRSGKLVLHGAAEEATQVAEKTPDLSEDEPLEKSATPYEASEKPKVRERHWGRIELPAFERRPPPDTSICTASCLKPRTAPSRLLPWMASSGTMQSLSSSFFFRRKAVLEPWETGEKPKGPTPGRSLTFDTKWKARTIRIAPDLAHASWCHFDYGGFALSAQRAQRKNLGRWFEVGIDVVETGKWSDGLGIGFAVHPVWSTRLLPSASLEGFACELLPQSWLIGYDGCVKLCGETRYLVDAEFPNGSWKPSELRPGDVVGLLSTQEGHLMLFVNQQLRIGVPNCRVPWAQNLFAVVDIDGCTKALHFLDTNGQPSTKVLRAAATWRRNHR